MTTLTLLLAITFLLIPFVMLFLLYNERTYLFIFEHSEWKLWRELLKTPKEDYTFVGVSPNRRYASYKVKSHPHWEIICDTQSKETWVMNRQADACILCTFHQRPSRKLYKKLIQ